MRPHGLQHTRLPCPSLSPIVCSNSCPSSQGCHPTSSSSLVHFPSFIFPSIRVFSNESVLLIRRPKYCSCSFSVSPSNKYSELISFRNDWFDLLAAQETLKSLFQHHSFKTSTLQCSTFFMVQLNWKDRFSRMVHPYVTTGKTIATTIWTFVSKVMSLLFHILSRAEHLEYPGLIFPCHNFKASAQYGKPNWG